MAELKLETTADLFNKINTISCEHVVLNPNIDSPYDHYIEFLKEIQSIYSPEQISEISRQSKYGSMVNGSIPPSLISSLAFNRLNKIILKHKQGETIPEVPQTPAQPATDPVQEPIPPKEDQPNQNQTVSQPVEKPNENTPNINNDNNNTETQPNQSN